MLLSVQPLLYALTARYTVKAPFKSCSKDKSSDLDHSRNSFQEGGNILNKKIMFTYE